MTDENKCPVLQHDHSARGSSANQHWWPNQLNLNMLHQGNPTPTRWTPTSTTPPHSTAST